MSTDSPNVQIIKLDPNVVREKLRLIAVDLENSYMMGIAAVLDDYDLLRLFHLLHIKCKPKDEVQADLFDILVSREMGVPSPKRLHQWFIDFYNRSGELIPDQPNTLVQVPVPRRESDIDLGEALATLYQDRVDLLSKLKTEIGNGPALAYFDKFNKALDGIEGTLSTIMDYRHKRDTVERAGTVHVQHSVDAAVQLVADLGDDDKMTLQAIGAGLLKAISGEPKPIREVEVICVDVDPVVEDSDGE